MTIDNRANPNHRFTRLEVETIQIGQTGLYPFGRDRPVVDMHEVQTSLDGKAFRWVEVASPTGNATIGFIVGER